MSTHRPRLLRSLLPLIYLSVAIILFFFTFPNALFAKGLGFLGFFCLAPLPLVLRNIRFRVSPIVGFLYGYGSYVLFNAWLGTFNPAAFLFVPVIYGIYHLLLFPLLHLIQQWFPRWYFIIQALAWLVYEYLRIQGYLGYSFGVLGYSQSFYPSMIQNAEWLGVWGLTFFCALTGFFLGYVFDVLVKARKKTYQKTVTIHTIKKILVPTSSALILLLLCNIVFGIQRRSQAVEKEFTLSVALIQHNTDPWKGGFSAYRTSLNTLIDLSDAAIQESNPDLIVWSETAFVPSINFHLTHRRNARYLRLINKLQDYLARYPNKDFVIGNSYSFLDKGERKDHNAAILFSGGEFTQVYSKIHLVPFTEHFPFETLFPRIHAYLIKNDVHYWEEGKEHTVFKSRFGRFSTPICFEDGFGKQNSTFVNNGAQFLINITNDAWSGVESNAMQHLQLSVFRAVENRIPVLRSTNGGITAVLNHKGEIAQSLDSFTKDYLVTQIDIPVEDKTLYARAPDIIAILATITLGSVLLFRLFVGLSKRHSKQSHCL